MQKAINYLKTHRFKKHSSGNYGMYGLNFLGADPVIQMNGTIWKFLYWRPNTEYAIFVNANGCQYKFRPKDVYYSDNRNDIIRMEEYIEEDMCENNKIIDLENEK